MAEWLKAQSWKDCILQKGIEGSNPSLSENLNPPMQSVGVFKCQRFSDIKIKLAIIYYSYALYL